MNIIEWVKDSETLIKVSFLLSVCAISFMMGVAGLMSITSYIEVLRTENETLRNLTYLQKSRISELEIELNRKVPYLSAIKKCESNEVLMELFYKIKKLDRGINDDFAKATIYYISIIAPEYGLDPQLVVAIGFVESRFTHLIGDGDFGIMQINYEIWKENLNIVFPDLFNLENNVRIACKILAINKVIHGEAKYIERYNGRGPRAQAYEKKVLNVYNKIKI